MATDLLGSACVQLALPLSVLGNGTTKGPIHRRLADMRGMQLLWTRYITGQQRANNVKRECAHAQLGSMSIAIFL